MKPLFAAALIGLCAWAPAPARAEPTQGLKLSYVRSSNGSPVAGEDPIWVFASPTEALISAASIQAGQAAFPYEQTLARPAAGELLQLARLDREQAIATLDSESLAKQHFEFSDETRTLLGHVCKKATTVVNSNHIELWYTTDVPVKGAPTALGQNLGLVLELVRNGNFAITATSIEPFEGVDLDALAQGGATPPPLTDGLSYKDRLWKSRFTTIPVVSEQVVHFSDQPPLGATDPEVRRFAKGTLVLKTIRFPEIRPGSQVFVDLKEQSNGDAYDRTGSVFVIPQGRKHSFLEGLERGVKALPSYSNGNGKDYRGVVATEDFAPLLELMRFFTPFGVHQYQHIQLKDKVWHDLAPYRMDISDLQSSLSGQTLAVGVFIGNYDKGGHKVSMNITIHPGDPADRPQRRNKVVLPLFNTTNVMEMASQEYGTMFDRPKGLALSFTLDHPLRKARLRYISTGHGGWENGDEFVPKKNTLVLDGKEVASFVPWRQDCGAFRLFNPASGNFNDGLSSSDLSRSNWCPGTATNPVYIELGELKPGRHQLSVRIPQGPKEGESFSAWNVSGVLLGE